MCSLEIYWHIAYNIEASLQVKLWISTYKSKYMRANLFKAKGDKF